MKSTELRIGNLIYYSQSPESDQPYDVVKTNLNDIHSLQLKESMDLRYAPIPLTEQWFEKFGGYKSEIELCSYRLFSVTRDYDFCKVELIDGDFYWWCDQIIGDTCITYVHELQNLFFALTRQELEIIK
jgi:hypothetical protein